LNWTKNLTLRNVAGGLMVLLLMSSCAEGVAFDRTEGLTPREARFCRDDAITGLDAGSADTTETKFKIRDAGDVIDTFCKKPR